MGSLRQRSDASSQIQRREETDSMGDTHKADHQTCGRDDVDKISLPCTSTRGSPWKIDRGGRAVNRERLRKSDQLQEER